MRNTRQIMEGYKGLIVKFCGQTNLGDELIQHEVDETDKWSPSKRDSHQKNEEIIYFPSSDGIYDASRSGFKRGCKAIANTALGTKSSRPGVQIVVAWPEGTPRETVVRQTPLFESRIKKELGMEDQLSVAIVHGKARGFPKLKQRLLSSTVPLSISYHMHLFASLVRADGEVINTYRFIKKLNEIRQKLDLEFGYHPVHNDVDISVTRRNGGFQDSRTGSRRREVARAIQMMWDESPDTKAFRITAERSGFLLERGHKAAIVIRMTETGASYSLKGLLGRNTREKDMLSCFTPDELRALPSSKPSRRQTKSLRIRRQIARSNGAYTAAARCDRIAAPMFKVGGVNYSKSRSTKDDETKQVSLRRLVAEPLRHEVQVDDHFSLDQFDGDENVIQNQYYGDLATADDTLNRTLAGNNEAYQRIISSRTSSRAERKLAGDQKNIADKNAFEQAAAAKRVAADKSAMSLKTFNDQKHTKIMAHRAMLAKRRSAPKCM